MKIYICSHTFNPFIVAEISPAYPHCIPRPWSPLCWSLEPISRIRGIKNIGSTSGLSIRKPWIVAMKNHEAWWYNHDDGISMDISLNQDIFFKKPMEIHGFSQCEKALTMELSQLSPWRGYSQTSRHQKHVGKLKHVATQLADQQGQVRYLPFSCSLYHLQCWNNEISR